MKIQTFLSRSSTFLAYVKTGEDFGLIKSHAYVYIGHINKLKNKHEFMILVRFM